jgi:inhibitor of KinA sporulation pathway (predicted exonuclease)
MRKELFTCFDIELNQASTGAKIIQIGAVVGNITTGEVIEKLSCIVNPNEILEPFIISLTKIKQEDVDNGTTLQEAYQQLKTLHLKYDSFCNPITWGQGDVQALIDELKVYDPTFKDHIFVEEL